MGKYFKEQQKSNLADKIRQGHHIPWNIIASKIYNEQINPSANREQLNNSPDYVSDWLKMKPHSEPSE